MNPERTQRNFQVNFTSLSSFPYYTYLSHADNSVIKIYIASALLVYLVYLICLICHRGIVIKTKATSTRCLLCLIQDRRIGIPASAVVRICDYRVEPAFPFCASWVGGFADMEEDGPLLSLRLLGTNAGQESRRCRGVLVDDGSGARLLIEINTVLRLTEVISENIQVVTGFSVPESWLSCCQGGDEVLINTQELFNSCAAEIVT